MLHPARVRQLDRYDDFYDDLLRIAARQGQMPQITSEYECDSSHLFAGFVDEGLAGFLRLTLEQVGDSSHPLSFQGQPVREGIIKAIGVHRSLRREGIAALMVDHATSVAQSRGAHQLRIMASGEDPILHQMFLAAGGVAYRNGDEFGFILKIG